jgi:aspartate ammonia-lyase
MEPVITFALFTSIATMEHASTASPFTASTASPPTPSARATWCSTRSASSPCRSPRWLQAVRGNRARGLRDGKSLHQIVVEERKLLTQEKWDDVFSFANLISPKFER